MLDPDKFKPRGSGAECLQWRRIHNVFLPSEEDVVCPFFSRRTPVAKPIDFTAFKWEITDELCENLRRNVIDIDAIAPFDRLDDKMRKFGQKSEDALIHAMFCRENTGYLWQVDEVENSGWSLSLERAN